MLQLPHCNKSLAGPDPTEANTDKKAVLDYQQTLPSNSFHCNTHLNCKFQPHATHYVIHFSVAALISPVLRYSCSREKTEEILDCVCMHVDTAAVHQAVPDSSSFCNPLQALSHFHSCILLET